MRFAACALALAAMFGGCLDGSLHSSHLENSCWPVWQPYWQDDAMWQTAWSERENASSPWTVYEQRANIHEPVLEAEWVGGYGVDRILWTGPSGVSVMAERLGIWAHWPANVSHDEASRGISWFVHRTIASSVHAEAILAAPLEEHTWFARIPENASFAPVGLQTTPVWKARMDHNADADTGGYEGSSGNLTATFSPSIARLHLPQPPYIELSVNGAGRVVGAVSGQEFPGEAAVRSTLAADLAQHNMTTEFNEFAIFGNSWCT